MADFYQKGEESDRTRLQQYEIKELSKVIFKVATRLEELLKAKIMFIKGKIYPVLLLSKFSACTGCPKQS